MPEYTQNILSAAEQLKKHYVREEDILSLIFLELVLLKETERRQSVRHSPDSRQLIRFLQNTEAVSFFPNIEPVIRKLLAYTRLSLLPQSLFQTPELHQLLSEIAAVTQYRSVSDAAEEILRDFARRSVLLQGDIPFEIARLIGGLCGEIAEGSSVWDPYCGMGLLLACLDNPSHTPLAGSEQNTLLWLFANCYHYLRTGYILSPGPSSHPDHSQAVQQYDLIVSKIPFGAQDKAARSKEDIIIQDIKARLNQNGRAFLLIPNGILFREGNCRGLRARLLKDRSIRGIIYLPSRILANTTVSCSILMLQEHASADEIRLIDVESNPQWYQTGRQSQLTAAAIREIPQIISGNRPGGAETRLITAAQYNTADFRLDRQFFFHSDKACAGNTTAHLQNEARQAYLACLAAHEKTVSILEKYRT